MAAGPPETSTPNLGGSGTGHAKACTADHASTAERVATLEGLIGTIGGVWYYGHGLPSDAVGKNGDLYLDIDTADVYAKENGSWV